MSDSFLLQNRQRAEEYSPSSEGSLSSFSSSSMVAVLRLSAAFETSPSASRGLLIGSPREKFELITDEASSA